MESRRLGISVEAGGVCGSKASAQMPVSRFHKTVINSDVASIARGLTCRFYEQCGTDPHIYDAKSGSAILSVHNANASFIIAHQRENKFQIYVIFCTARFHEYITKTQILKLILPRRIFADKINLLSMFARVSFNLTMLSYTCKKYSAYII